MGKQVQLVYSLVHEQRLTICPVLGEYVQRCGPGAALCGADNTHRFQRSTRVDHQAILGVTAHGILGGGIDGQIGAPGLHEKRAFRRLCLDVPGKALAAGVLRFQRILQFILAAGALQLQLLAAIRLPLKLVRRGEEHIGKVLGDV